MTAPSGSVPEPAERLCTRRDCDQRAITAVHHIGPWIAVRPDHLTDGFAADWRCHECAVEEVEMVMHHDEVMAGYEMQEEA